MAALQALLSSQGGYYNCKVQTENLMSLRSDLLKYPILTALGMRWLVLVVITIGIIASSIGITTSHGVAIMAALHESEPPSFESLHGHDHAQQGGELAAAHEIPIDEHPHHGMDHSHDTAHCVTFAWSAASPEFPGWEVMVPPSIEMGQTYRLDRPPMG